MATQESTVPTTVHVVKTMVMVGAHTPRLSHDCHTRQRCAVCTTFVNYTAVVVNHCSEPVAVNRLQHKMVKERDPELVKRLHDRIGSRRRSERTAAGLFNPFLHHLFTILYNLFTIQLCAILIWTRFIRGTCSTAWFRLATSWFTT